MPRSIVESLEGRRFLSVADGPVDPAAMTLAAAVVEPRARVVTIAEPTIERAVRAAIDKPEGPLTRADLLRVTRLNIDNYRLTSITGLAGLTNLRRLDVYAPEVTDLRPLRGLTKLEHLSLHVGGGDLRHLSRMTRLRFLWADRLGKTADLTPLRRMRRLEELFIEAERLDSVRGIGRATNLTRLSIPRSHLRDITALARLPGLKHVMLDQNDLTDLSPLHGLEHLTFLRVWENRLRLTTGSADWRFVDRLRDADARVLYTGQRNGPFIRTTVHGRELRRTDWEPIGFGPVAPGEPSRRVTFRIHNAGRDELEIDSVELPEGFELVTPAPRTVPAGGTAAIGVVFEADAAGAYVGHVRVSHNDALRNPTLIPVAGRVRGAAPAVDPVGVYEGRFLDVGAGFFDRSGERTFMGRMRIVSWSPNPDGGRAKVVYGEFREYEATRDGNRLEAPVEHYRFFFRAKLVGDTLVGTVGDARSHTSVFLLKRVSG